MTRSFVRSALLTATLALTACGSEARPERTDATTRGLLDAASATAVGEIPGVGEAPIIDVATLGFDRGAKNSPVRVVEMSDYGCGYCRQFHLETWPALLTEFVESGKVEWKFMPFITGMFENSLPATQAAECSLEQSPDLFLVMNERIWEQQAAWKKGSDPAGVVRGFASDLGLDMAAYDGCIDAGRRMDRIAAATSLARQLGVRGTPTFFVVGYPPVQGALPKETFQQILNQVYVEATGTGGN